MLYGNISRADTAGYTRIPFEFSKGILIPRFPVTVTLAGGDSFTGRVMFDCGNALTLIVSTPFSKFHDFNRRLGPVIYGQGRGLNAVTTDQVAAIRSMSFDGFDFGRMVIRLTVNDKAEPKDGYLGILGTEVIRRFNVIIDYAGHAIFLKPNGNYRDPFVFPPGTEALREKN